MIADIRHSKLNMNRAILHSESATRKECVLPKNDKKNKIINKSANVTFTGGFFSPEKQDNISFSGDPKKGFWKWVGEIKGVQNFIKGKKLDNILEKANNLAWFESILMCLIAVTIKPTTIMALPGAKEEDKKYAATKAFLGGCVDFAIASAIVLPITTVFDKFNDKIKADPNKFLTENMKYLKDEKRLKNFSKILGYAPKLLLVPVRSALTIALIPPTLKYFFPEEAKKLKDKKDTKDAVKSKIKEGGNK